MPKGLTIPDINQDPMVAPELKKLKLLCSRRDEARREVEELKGRCNNYAEGAVVALLENPTAVIDDTVTRSDLERAEQRVMQFDKAAQAQSAKVKDLRRKASNREMVRLHRHRRDAIRKCHKLMQPIRELCEDERKLDRQLQASNMQGVDHCRFLGLVAGIEPADWFNRWEALYKEYL